MKIFEMSHPIFFFMPFPLMFAESQNIVYSGYNYFVFVLVMSLSAW